MAGSTAREAELGGPLPHLAELGVDEADLRAYGADNIERTPNVVLQAAKSHSTATAQVRCAQVAVMGIGFRAGWDEAAKSHSTECAVVERLCSDVVYLP